MHDKKTLDVLTYIDQRYPCMGDVSDWRKEIVYLADWRSAIDQGNQLTTLQWYYGSSGPYAINFPYIHPRQDEREMILSLEEQFILDFVLTTVRRKRFPEVIQLVLSTYPFVTCARNTPLDLPVIARRYRQDAKSFGWWPVGGLREYSVI